MKGNHSILLVQPSRHARGTLCKEPFARFQSLSLAYIAASTPGHWRVDIIDESLDNLPPLSCYDIVGVSTTTRNALRAYQIAEEARAEDCYTVAGGIHATMRTDESLRFFDTIIAGEGAYPWRLFLRDFEKGDPNRLYRAFERESMDSLPLPDRSRISDDYGIGSIQTSRGCPFNCSFCSVTAFNGKKYRIRSPELVLDELATIPQKYIFFVDDNPVGNTKRSFGRAKRIFRGILRGNSRSNIWLR